ncbi:hypothetical protein RBSWK_01444 [Rhodopirellula baltica SWK14]|uniref:Uncharacterized protein n=1 Tax=Rhodopirellula baltica SWK14 TaxID=993516 RepID=L7CLW5_RHOBT|nr:hypothetical protein RBSWK_01444 [Rhodopirellula baltica SWK14]
MIDGIALSCSSGKLDTIKCHTGELCMEGCEVITWFIQVTDFGTPIEPEGWFLWLSTDRQ